MRHKLLLTAAEGVLPSFDHQISGVQSSGPEKKSGKETGTTIFVFRAGEKGKVPFLVCGADKKVSYGHGGIASQRFKKIFHLSDTSLFLGSGGVGNIQELLHLLRGQCEEFQQMHGLPISIPGQTRLLVEWCNIFRRFFEGYRFSFGSIIAGMNEDGSLQMFAVDDDGSRMEIKSYYATGSGGDSATTIFDKEWRLRLRGGMDLGLAVDLAVQAIYFAAMRDNGSSDPRIAVPSVSIIHPVMGIVTLPRDTVDHFSSEFLSRHDGEHNRPIPEVDPRTLKPRRRRTPQSRRPGRKK
jgi:20S proteasome alpha/beta subunit